MSTIIILYAIIIIAGLLFLICNDVKIKKVGKIILIVFAGVPVVIGVIGVIGFILLFMTCVTGLGR